MFSYEDDPRDEARHRRLRRRRVLSPVSTVCLVESSFQRRLEKCRVYVCCVVYIEVIEVPFLTLSYCYELLSCFHPQVYYIHHALGARYCCCFKA